MLSLEAPAKEKIEHEPYYGEENQTDNPCYGTDWIAVFLQDHDNTAHNRDDVSGQDDEKNPGVDGGHQQNHCHNLKGMFFQLVSW